MIRTVLAVATTAVALCLAGAAVAAPPEGSLRLTLVGADEGQTGPRSFFFTETVYQNGRVVGSDRASCRFTGRFENPRCRITLSLPGGNLSIFLRLTPDPRGNFTVTDGTGKYEGKTGTGIYRSVGPNVTRLTIWLT